MYGMLPILQWLGLVLLVSVFVPPPIQQKGSEALCFRVVRPYVRVCKCESACSGGGIPRPACRRVLVDSASESRPRGARQRFTCAHACGR